MSKILKWLHFEDFSPAIIQKKSFDDSFIEHMKHDIYCIVFGGFIVYLCHIIYINHHFLQCCII